MSNDTLVLIDGIKGECLDLKYPDAIEAWSWSWMIHQAPGTLYSKSGQGPRAAIEDFVFTHSIDRASPSLVAYCSRAQHIPKVQIFGRKATGSTPLNFLMFTLEDALITSVKPSGGGSVIVETVSISFVRMKYEYTLQSERGWTAGTVTSIIDQRSNIG
jgi:type VI secretion system secreted protein Hcp